MAELTLIEMADVALQTPLIPIIEYVVFEEGDTTKELPVAQKKGSCVRGVAVGKPLAVEMQMR